MDLDSDQCPSPKDVYLLDAMGLSLKWAKSPSKSTHLQISLPTSLDEVGPSGEHKGVFIELSWGENAGSAPQLMVVAISLMAGNLPSISPVLARS